QPQVARTVAIKPFGAKTRARKPFGDQWLAAGVVRSDGRPRDQQLGEFKRGRHDTPIDDQIFSVNSVKDAESGTDFWADSRFTTGLPALLISHSRLFLESAAASASSRVIVSFCNSS